MTDINDLVLIHFENTPVFYARVEGIEPDIKPGWYHVKLLLLQIPLQTVTWILRDVYINGQEFTMGGKKMRLEKVISPDDNEEDRDFDNPKQKIKENTAPVAEKKQDAKIISLADMKKKK